MNNTLKLLATGLFASTFSLSAAATMVSFDHRGDFFEERNSVLDDYNDFVVRGGLASKNLANGVSFNRLNDATAKDVIRDVTPSFGGLGVFSGVNGDTDNFEGSLGGDTNNDEIIFFDFNRSVELTNVWLNAGDDGNPGDLTGNRSHQEYFTDEASDLFDIFFSTDGKNYSSIFGANTAPVSSAANAGNEDTRELLTGLGGQTAQWFAVAHVGPISSVGGYIEKIDYNVPEPGTLALLGLGLAGFGLSRRRKQA